MRVGKGVGWGNPTVRHAQQRRISDHPADLGSADRVRSVQLAMGTSTTLHRLRT
jgi:hypothetical protein